MDINWATVIVGVVPAIVTWFVARTDTKGNIQSKEVEVKPTSDKVNLEHTTALFEEYRGQVENYKKRLEDLEEKDRSRQQSYNKLQDDYASVLRKVTELQQEMNRLKADNHQEIEGYKNSLMQKEDRIEDLKMEVLELVEENERLKEELNGHST